jgi:hypothetical protein
VDSAAAGLRYPCTVNQLQVNAGIWRAFERGQIAVETLRAERFRRLFQAVGIDLDPVPLSERCLVDLGERADQICSVFAISAPTCAAQTRDPDEIIGIAWVKARDLDAAQYEIDDMSRQVLSRRFAGACALLPLQAWLGRDGQEASLFL